MSSIKEFKEKIEGEAYDEDYLPVFTDIPLAQKYQVVNYIENQKSAAQAWEELCMFEFMKTMSASIYKKTIEAQDFALFGDKYTTFKDINKQLLQKKFVQEFGSDYDRYRIWCSFGSYPSKKAALKVAEDLAKTRGKLYGSFVVVENGYYLPFNPTPEMCSDQQSTNKIMNEFAKGQIENKAIRNALFNKRKDTLIEKSIRDGKERGQKIEVRGRDHTAPENFEDEFKKYDLADNIELTLRDKEGQEREAREMIDMELKIGQYEIISLDALKMLGYPEETIEFVRLKQEEKKKAAN